MKIMVFDIEADDYFEGVSVVHVLSYRMVGESGVRRLVNPTALDLLTLFNHPDIIYVAHNGYGYDFPVLVKLYGVYLDVLFLDTIMLSRLWNPDRVGGHSLDNLSKTKIKYEGGFEEYTEEMGDYCDGDVRSTEKILREFLNRLPDRDADGGGSVESRAARLCVRLQISPESYRITAGPHQYPG